MLVNWIRNNRKKSLILILLLFSLFMIISNQITNYDETGTSVKTFGAKGDGKTDDTKAIEAAFNSDVGDLYFPNGTYKVTSEIVVEPGKARRVSGESDVIISVSLEAGQNLFTLNRNMSFENIEFDFNHGFLQYGLFFRDELGEISLKNIKFRNVKDTNNTDGTIVVYVSAKGNELNIQNVHFNDMKKKGNGVIGDGAGNLTCLYVRGTDDQSAAVGHIKGVRITNVHNIDKKNGILFEDISGIYIITSKKDTNNDLKIEDVSGYNFGKRLIKLHASNVTIEKISAYSDTNDAHSAINVLSGSGPGTKSNVIITDVKVRGKFNVALASAGKNTIFRDIDIKVEKRNLERERNSYGVLITGGNIFMENAEIEAEQPLSLLPSNNQSIKGAHVKETTLYVPDGSDWMIGKELEGFSLEDVTIKYAEDRQ